MRISDWSSDVCSSDLGHHTLVQFERGCVAINRGGNPSWRRNLLCFVAPCVRASGAAGGHPTAPGPPWCSGLTCFYPTLQTLGGPPARGGGWEKRRTDERRYWNECVSTCRTWWWPGNLKKQDDTIETSTKCA